MNYIVTVISKANDGSMRNPVSTFYSDFNLADAKFHEEMKTACTTTLPHYAVVMVDENGAYIKGDFKDHPAE